MDTTETPSPPKKKKRGPYKTYLLNPSSEKEIPGGTLRSRKKVSHEGPRAELNAEENVEGEDIVYEQPPPTQEPEKSQDEPSHSEEENNDIQNLSGTHISQHNASDSHTSEGDSEQAGSANQDDSREDTFNHYERSHGNSGEEQQETDIEDDSENIENQSASTQDDHDEDEVYGEAQPKQKVNYIQKYHLNEKLHPISPLSRLDALLMILHLAIRHSHTQSFIEDQIKFVNTLFGSPVLDISYHIFKNVFPSSSTVQRHYYCESCEIYVGSCQDFPKDLSFTNCPRPECGKRINLNSVDSKNYFITLSIKDQIESLLSRSDVQLMLKQNRNTDDICDVFDGELYKKLSQSNGNGDVLTCVLNTDGVQVFEDNRGSLWPIFLHLNELAPEIRFKTENLILAGLWFGKGSPNMALYFKPVLKQLMSLSQSGITVPQTDGNVQCPLFAVGLSVDSVAKPKIVCQRQFNGGHSCLYCYHPNDAVADENNPHLKHFDTTSSYPNRTEQEVIKDMFQADTLERSKQLKKSSVRGFLGVSVFLMLSQLMESVGYNPFHIVWSLVIDYMHALLEGVASDLLTLYLGMLSEEKVEIMNNRLEQITLPQGISRKPRRLDGKVKYKAKEYRSFFLYFAIPCLEDLLPARQFHNLKLFVKVLHILLADKISRRVLESARKDLHDFVCGFQTLYGLKEVTYNLHTCTHLVDMVIQNGPLWAYSNFIFESGNGLLVKLVRGTRSVINEISVKFTRLQAAQLQIDRNPVSDEALKFCSEVLGCKYTKAERYEDVSVTGSQTFMQVSDHENNLLEEHNVPVVNGKVKVFNRVLRNGQIYVSKSYSKAKTTNDSCVQLEDGSYVTIDKVILTNDKLLKCIVHPIRLAEENNLLPSIKKCAFDVHAPSCIVNFSQISRKCVFINFDSKSFVIDIPNFYERD